MQAHQRLSLVHVFDMLAVEDWAYSDIDLDSLINIFSLLLSLL